MIFDRGEYSCSAAMNRECFTGFNSPTNKKSKDKRRFSDEQTKSLETIFESESKLEPRKKLQLATDLGLQPRQVAIWFQNKRARWKSKQLEQDYSMLRTNYNNLSSKFEALKKEKQSLVIQLQKLNDLMQKSRGENRRCEQAVAEDSTSGQLESGDRIKDEFGEKPSISLERSEYGFLSDDDISLTAEYLGLDEEPKLLNTVEPADRSLTSPENWGTLDSIGLLDQRGSSYQWWDFWS